MRSETQGHGLCVSSPQMLRVTETDVHLDPQGGYIWEEHHRTLQIQYIYFIVDRISAGHKWKTWPVCDLRSNFPPLAVIFVLIVCGVAYLPMRWFFASPVKEHNSVSIYPPLNDHDEMDEWMSNEWIISSVRQMTSNSSGLPVATVLNDVNNYFWFLYSVTVHSTRGRMCSGWNHTK